MNDAKVRAAMEGLQDLVNGFAEDCQAELRSLWNALPVSIPERELFEVVGGLLSRQMLLLRQLSFSTAFWNYDAGSLVLRSMVDTHIIIAYICNDRSLDRARAFINHGLGQERLYVSKIKARASAMGDTELMARMEEYEKELDGEKYGHLTDVEYGSWTGKDNRRLAQELGLEEYYDGTFPTLSAGTHGGWNHLLKFNAVPSDNPLHAGLKRPVLEPSTPDINVLFLAGGQMEMSFRLVHERFGIVEPETSPTERLQQKLDELMTKPDEEAC